MFNQKSELVHKTDCSAIVCSIFPLAKWIENNSLMPGYFCKHITEDCMQFLLRNHSN